MVLPPEIEPRGRTRALGRASSPGRPGRLGTAVELILSGGSRGLAADRTPPPSRAWPSAVAGKSAANMSRAP
ncbi:MAG: hypothetical protein ACYCO3_01460 [Mycobacteriales bacterium]